MQTNSGPLAHVKVLDLSRILAAPWSAQILADLGASVIKVERPGNGDDTRAWGPPFLKDAQGADTSEAGYYLAVNRGKQSITVNLDSAEGQAIVRALALECDIVLENYKVGSLERYGLDQASLRKLNPRLIYCSVTGFGQTGPRRHQSAYDFLIQAMGGLMSVTGEKDGKPGAGPQKVGVPIVDLMTGMYATVAVLAALAKRNETGIGDNIDISMLDVQVASLANQAMNYLVSNKLPTRNGNAHPNIQPQDVFSCRDADFILVVGNDSQFRKLCEVLEVSEWAQDSRFATNPERVRHIEVLMPLLRQRFALWPRAELIQALDKAGVPAGPINSVKDVFEEPQIIEREMLKQVPHSLGIKVPQVSSPMRFSESRLTQCTAPPLLGEHTESILSTLGYSAAQINALRTSGAI
jgi:crotonobetainyl-CoA:carnitine CoA-transferase CaiB-like acyl-CoA transferase